MALMPCSLLPEILLLFLTWDGTVKAQLVTAGVCSFAFSDIPFLAQLHCLRCELVAERRVVLVRRWILSWRRMISVSQQTDYAAAQARLQFQN